MSQLKTFEGARLCTRCMTRGYALLHPTLGPVCPACLRPMASMPAPPLSKKERRMRRRFIEEVAAEPTPATQPKRKSHGRKRPKIGLNRRLAIYQRDGLRCLHCGSTSLLKLTIDHIVPLSKGGSNADDNLQTLCRQCNNRKGSLLAVPERATA